MNEEMSLPQNVGKTFDFDAFMAEQNREPLKVKVFGEWYDLAPGLPAGFVLELMKMQKEGKSVSDVVLIETGLKIFGKNHLDTWIEKGLDMSQLEVLLKWATEQYTLGPKGKKPASRGKK